METQKATQELSSGKEIFIKMATSAWETQVARVNKILDNISDAELLSETAPGRNSGIYLLGHLTAVSDAIIPILGWGERLYPQLDNIFIITPDKSGPDKPSVAELKEYWKKVNDKITNHINEMKADSWFTKHASISEEDFAKEPHRNKLNILINRTNHLSYHLGQLIYLVKQK